MSLSASDVLAIRDIVSVWNIAEDEGDAARWADLFAEDGVSVYGNGRVESGREVLLAAARRRAVDPRMFAWSHWTLGDPTIEPTEEGGALMRHYYMTLNEPAPHDFEIWSLTERVYRVRRIDGRWRIAERTIHKLPLGLAAEVDRARSGVQPVTDTEDQNGSALTAADRLDIHDLITRYSVSEDTGDARETASLFTEDGSTVNGRGEAVIGRDAIEQAATRRWENPAARTKVHWAANVIITATDEGAAAQSYHMIISADAGFAFESVVTKRDRFRKVDGRWLFVERRVEPIGRKNPNDGEK